MQIISSETGFLSEHVAFGELGDHVEDKCVADYFEERGVAGGLAREVDGGAAHDAAGVGGYFGAGGGGASDDADKLPVVGHGWGAEDFGEVSVMVARLSDHIGRFTGHADEFGTGRCESFFEAIGCVGMNGGTVDDHFSIHIFLKDGVNSGVHSGIIAKTHEYDVRPFDCIVDIINDFCLVGA